MVVVDGVGTLVDGVVAVSDEVGASVGLYVDLVGDEVGSGVGLYIGLVGNLSVRRRISAILSNVFFVALPACKLGVVVDGGVVRRVMMSSAACLRKLSNFTFGKVICLGKNVTVSTSRTAVLGSNLVYICNGEGLAL